MAIIATRKPYLITYDTTSLQVQTRTWYSTETEPTTWDYTIDKTSYEVGVSEQLSIDVSPFILPDFVMTPQANPTNITPILETEWLNVKLNVNGVEETHNAVNGYTAPIDEYYYDHWQTVKNVQRDTDAQLSLPPGVYTVTWTTNDGQIATEDTTSTEFPHTARIANTNLDLSTSNTLKIETGIITYNYDLTCVSGATIGFVNAKGMWEYFDANGRLDEVYGRTADTYTQYSSGELRDINVNGSVNVKFNTGWVDAEFRRVISEFMMSEHIIWSRGSEWGRMVLRTNSMRRQTKENDKMMNYTFDCELSSLIIPNSPSASMLFDI